MKKTRMLRDPNALIFDEKKDNSLAFDPTVFKGAEDPIDIISRAKDDKISNLRAAISERLEFLFLNQ